MLYYIMRAGLKKKKNRTENGLKILYITKLLITIICMNN